MHAKLANVSKDFGDFRALDEVDFELRAGEVHALVGENGAGKSTLMRILAGQLAATTGSLTIDGKNQRVDHALTARRPGVGFVEQEGGLILELSAAENLVLLEAQGFWSSTRAAARAVNEAGERLGQQVDLNAPVGTLPFGDRQRVELALMLAAGARILVLDEPTACLGPEDAAQLAVTVRTLVADGGSVVYISHKLREVLEVADRVTVLRRGRVIAHHATVDGLTVEQLGREMVGVVGGRASVDEQMLEIVTAERAHDLGAASGEVVCALEDVVVTARPGVGVAPRREPLDRATLSVRAGEILGVAGVVGSGQQTLAEVLVGLTDAESGSVSRKGGAIAYIPEARRRDAIAVGMSVADNLVVHSHRTLGSGPFLSHSQVLRNGKSLVEKYGIRTPSVSVRIGALSGGNQQRAVVARELDRAPVLVVAHNPFRGLDVQAIADVEKELVAAARSGAAVVLLSPDFDELHRICSRVAVLFSGRVVGEVDPRDTTDIELGRLMGGAV